MKFKLRLLTVYFIILMGTSASIMPESFAQSYDKSLVQDSIEILKAQAIQFAKKGKYKDSHEVFQKILKFKQSIFPEIHPEIAHTLVNLGVIYKEQGHYERSLEYYKKAEVIYEQSDTPVSDKLGTTYMNMANIFLRQKDIEKAETYYNKAINLYQQDSAKNKNLLAKIYNNMGNLHDDNNNYEKAIENYKKSLQIKKSGKREGLITTLGNLAVTYQNSGKYYLSEDYYQELINAIKEEYGEKSNQLAINYMNYGVLKLKQNNFHQANSLFQESLKLYKKYLGAHHPKTSHVYINLGDLEYQQGEYKSALQNYQQALISLSSEFTDTSIYKNPEISQVFLKKRFLKILKRKANRFRDLGTRDNKYYHEALKNYDLAIRITKAMRKGYLSEDSKLLLTAEEKNTYMNAMDAALLLYKKTGKKSYLNRAFTYAEGSKAAVLYESIQSNQALLQGNIPDSLKKKETSLKKQIYSLEELAFEEKQTRNPNKEKLANWNNQLFQLKNSYESLISKFEKEYPRFYQLKYNLQPTEIKSIQSNIKKENILVEYVIHKEKLIVFLIEKNNFSVNQTEITPKFQNAIYNLRNALSARNFSNHSQKDFNNFIDTSYYLYTKLIKPLNLPEDKQITIIPDDILAYIPFETLLTEKPTKSNTIKYNQLEYFIKKFNITYSYSAKILFSGPSSNKKSKKKVGAFAPSYENVESINTQELTTRQKYREKLYPLKGIIEEVNNITDIIPGDIYTDQNATEQQFKKHSGSYDILHLAMHTIVNDKEPMFSKMAFTDTEDEYEDGFLNTYEIYNLNLSSRLAVLSSCNTGVGKLRKGEGVMSLARGFKYAGCPSIVMTMWPVEDNSSIKLMEYFYEGIKSGIRKDQALRQAKIKFLNNSDPLRSHPYFWSGYILLGDNSAIYTNPAYYYFGGGMAFILVIFIIIFRLKKRK